MSHAFNLAITVNPTLEMEAVEAYGCEMAPLYAIGETVFITEHRFPGDVEAYTTNGGYIVNMANSGELGEFAPDELEDYDNERWNEG